MIQQIYKQEITQIPQYITVGNFIEQLNYYNNLNNKPNIDDDTKIEIALGFYMLFTNTFITESTNKHNIKYTFIENRQIIYGLKAKLSKQQYLKAKQTDKILIDKEDEPILRITYKNYTQQRDRDLKKNDIEKKQKITLNNIIDHKLYELFISQITIIDENLLDDILND